MKELAEKIDILATLVEGISRHQRLVMSKVEELGEHHQQLYRQQSRIYEQLDALFSIFSVLKFRHPLPTMRGWPVSPDFMKLVISFILERKPQCMVELGSGVSTIVSAYALEKNGSGMVCSYDHDEGFAEETRAKLHLHGLSGFAEVTHAPLKTLEIDGDSRLWYDPKSMDHLEEISILVVDGPPAATCDLARFPALPVLVEKMIPGGVVVLDDARRGSERKIVKLWQEVFPGLSSRFHDTEKGTCVLQLP